MKKLEYIRLMEQGLLASDLLEGDKCQPLKWVHENGVPQVIEIPNTPYGGYDETAKYFEMAVELHAAYQ